MDLQQRVERLERENRRLKLVGIGLFLLVGILGALQAGIGQPQSAYGQDKPKRPDADFGVVTARRLIIVDEDEKAKVLVAGEKQVNPQSVQGYIAVLDDKGNGSTILGHWGNGDALWFTGEKDGNNLYLAAQGQEVVIHSARQGRYNFRLFADGNGSALQFSDRGLGQNVKAPPKVEIEKHLQKPRGR